LNLVAHPSACIAFTTVKERLPESASLVIIENIITIISEIFLVFSKIYKVGLTKHLAI
jgi:hypothetical protein